MNIEEEIKSYKEKIKNIKNSDINCWTPNDIIIYDDYGEIILRGNKQEITGITKFDLEDLDLIKKYKWSNSGGYARASKNGITIRLHRLVMNTPEGRVVDHINNDTMDNRKQNLQVVSNKENLDFGKARHTKTRKILYMKKSEFLTEKSQRR